VARGGTKEKGEKNTHCKKKNDLEVDIRTSFDGFMLYGMHHESMTPLPVKSVCALHINMRGD
jgi:hypothetical protein